MKSILQILSEVFIPLKGVYPLDGALDTGLYHYALERRLYRKDDSKNKNDFGHSSGPRYNPKIND